MDLLSNFYGKAREHQISIIKSIEDALKNGYDNIILCAPTGTGKSYIAICLALSYGSSSILTATTDLQEQYMRDFPFTKAIKGKRNFTCLRIIDKKVPCSSISSSLCYNKSDGFCKYYPQESNFIREGNGMDEKIFYNNDNPICEYYKQKFEALLASHTIFNYHEYLSLLKFTKQAPYRDVMIYDEAHLLENRLVDFYCLEISNRLLKQVSMAFPSSELYEIETWIQLLYDLMDRYRSLLNDMSKRLLEANGNEFIALNDEISSIETNLERIEFIHNEISSNPDNYVVTIDRSDNKIVRARLLPIEVSKYTRDLFSMSKIRLFMSATIDNDTFSRSLALDKSSTIFISVDSPFPIENRRVYFLNRYRLNKNGMEDEYMIDYIAKCVEELMEKHKDERGLILVTNYALALAIKNKLTNNERLIVSNEVKREEIIDALARKRNNVIISPSLWDGIDLKDDLCRFIIITKAPYLDLNDRRVLVKMRKDREWYTMQSAMRLIQGCGRGVRHANDHCSIYILDKNAMYLIKSVGDKIPEWFKKACIF